MIKCPQHVVIIDQSQTRIQLPDQSQCGSQTDTWDTRDSISLESSYSLTSLSQFYYWRKIFLCYGYNDCRIIQNTILLFHLLSSHLRKILFVQTVKINWIIPSISYSLYSHLIFNFKRNISGTIFLHLYSFDCWTFLRNILLQLDKLSDWYVQICYSFIRYCHF